MRSGLPAVSRPRWAVPVAGTKPRIATGNVVLHAPLGPMMAFSLPTAGSKDTLVRTGTPPSVTDTLLSRNANCPAGARAMAVTAFSLMLVREQQGSVPSLLHRRAR